MGEEGRRVAIKGEGRGKGRDRNEKKDEKKMHTGEGCLEGL